MAPHFFRVRLALRVSCSQTGICADLIDLVVAHVLILERRTTSVGLSALAELPAICDWRSSPFAAWLIPFGRVPCFSLCFAASRHRTSLNASPRRSNILSRIVSPLTALDSQGFNGSLLCSCWSMSLPSPLSLATEFSVCCHSAQATADGCPLDIACCATILQPSRSTNGLSHTCPRM